MKTQIPKVYVLKVSKVESARAGAGFPDVFSLSRVLPKEDDGINISMTVRAEKHSGRSLYRRLNGLGNTVKIWVSDKRHMNEKMAEMRVIEVRKFHNLGEEYVLNFERIHSRKKIKVTDYVWDMMMTVSTDYENPQLSSLFTLGNTVNVALLK